MEVKLGRDGRRNWNFNVNSAQQMRADVKWTGEVREVEQSVREVKKLKGLKSLRRKRWKRRGRGVVGRLTRARVQDECAVAGWLLLLEDWGHFGRVAARQTMVQAANCSAR
jgi:hypothetical protein